MNPNVRRERAYMSLKQIADSDELGSDRAVQIISEMNTLVLPELEAKLADLKHWISTRRSANEAHMKLVSRRSS